MSAESTFQFASERLELAPNAVAVIAGGCPLDSAFALLSVLQLDEERHGGILYRALDKLAAVSDGPIKWKHGRGRSGLVRGAASTFPHVWSSAHQAALEISRLALEFFFRPLEGITDPGEQQAVFRNLLDKRRRKALALTMEEVADLQERIRRERAKLPAEHEWSESKSPADWCKELGVTHSTLKRHVKAGRLVVRKNTTKSWAIRLDTLRHYLGGN